MAAVPSSSSQSCKALRGLGVLVHPSLRSMKEHKEHGLCTGDGESPRLYQDRQVRFGWQLELPPGGQQSSASC